MSASKFYLGRLVIPPDVLNTLQRQGEKPLRYVLRHVSGDWGDVGNANGQANDYAVAHGGTLQSHYRLTNGQRLCILTTCDRSTTLLVVRDDNA